MSCLAQAQKVKSLVLGLEVFKSTTMNYYTIDPPKELVEHVRFFWVLEGKPTALRPFVHRALAEHCAELIFYYKGGFKILSDNHAPGDTFSSGIYGPTQQFYQFKTEKEFGMLGVYLYPYAIPRLFALPASELSNGMLDFETLCGQEGKLLEEQVVMASGNSERVQLISKFLTMQLRKSRTQNSGILYQIRNIVQSYQLTSVPALASECHLSRRRFERKFKELSGFSPKEFQRLIRFDAVVKGRFPVERSLAQLAAACGFYDQSHFIHEFQRFSGYSPKEFFKQKIAPSSYRAAPEFRL